MNRVVSDGILRGFREGLLTSTSVLANAPDVGRAIRLWKELSADHAAGRMPSMAARIRLNDSKQPFDLGVHLNLTQGRPLLGDRYPGELLDSRGRFPGVFALMTRLWRHSRRFHAAIRAELEQQVQVVCDHGLQPTHLNGHQYIEMMPTIIKILPHLLKRFDIKVVRVAREPSLLRSTVFCGKFWKWPLACVKRAFADRFRSKMDALGVAHTDVFFGASHAGNVDLQRLKRFLTSAQAAASVEVGLHPGEASVSESPEDRDDGWHDPLARSRSNELEMLTSVELSEFLESAGWRLGRLAM